VYFRRGAISTIKGRESLPGRSLAAIGGLPVPRQDGNICACKAACKLTREGYLMEESKEDEELVKKMKYVKPELISLDKDERAEGFLICSNGSGNNNACSAGGGVIV
jgi:hypothetical protein